MCQAHCGSLLVLGSVLPGSEVIAFFASFIGQKTFCFTNKAFYLRSLPPILWSLVLSNVYTHRTKKNISISSWSLFTLQSCLRVDTLRRGNSSKSNYSGQSVQYELTDQYELTSVIKALIPQTNGRFWIYMIKYVRPFFVCKQQPHGLQTEIWQANHSEIITKIIDYLRHLHPNLPLHEWWLLV